MAAPVTVRVEGLKEALDYFRSMAQDQFPFALSKACNDLAFEIRTAEMATMREVFKNPREKTVRNIRVFKGNKARPGATIAFNQIFSGDEYMVAQVEGGQRPMKRSEKALGRYWVPGIGAQLDQYGSMKGSQVLQILSSLSALKESGFKGNRTKGSTQPNQYFMITQKTAGLVPGVYQRVDRGQGQMLVARALANKPRGVKRSDIKAQYAKALNRGAVPVMIFVSKPPTYTKRFPFFEVANKVTNERFKPLMNEALAYARSTAR
jgi:hypothetical protein